MLFPNLREFKPIGCSDVNPEFYNDYPYQSTQDYLPNSFTNSTTTTINNFAIDSTSSSDRGVTGSPSDQRLPKKQGYSYDSSLYNNTQPSLAKPADESKFRDPEYLNPLDNIEHSLPKKKVKTEQVFNLDTFEEEFKKSAQFPWNIFDNIDDGLIDKYSSDQWLQPADSEEDFSSILKPKEPVENIPENKETSQTEESKCEDIVDRNYFVQIDFGSGIGTPKQAESPIQQADSSEGLSRNLQILKNCLGGVTELDYQRLDPEVYLNDNLINFYMKFIENGLLTEERRKKCHFFNTYFMAQMRKLFSAVDDDFSRFDSVYEKMGKWTKKTNIFEKDFLFIPINENEHWNLLILCNPSDLFSNNDNFPFIIFLDSLSRMDNVYSGMLFHYFYRELRSKMPEKFMALHTKVCKFSYSMFPYFQQMVPKQSNLTDCGLYLLQYIEMFAEDETPIIQGKEDNNKRRWFPRKLIQEKRNHMKKIIESLNNNQFEIIEEYRMERDQIIKDCFKRNDEYDTFNPKEFWQAVTRTYGNTVLTDQEKLCLMLDFYYFGTLDFNQTT